MDLDIYVQGPNGASAEETAALTLFSAAGELYRQGITKKGHLRWNKLAPAQYKIQVVAPGFERVVQEIDARSSGEVRANIQLRPQAGGERVYPPVSSDPEVNYVFGVYASRLGDWEQAKVYWTTILQLFPDHVPAMVSMSEALLNENRVSEAAEYLDRAAKTDPSYWRTQAVLAEVSLRAGSAGEAVHHAERAVELGHGEAASVSPLLARALVAEASEVLRTYLKDHPEDLAARKQFEALSTPTYSAAGTTAQPTSRPAESRWLPAEVDENVPPVEPGAACNLDEVLQKAGQRIQEFVGNVERFTATESLVHETITKSGKVSESEKRKYDYVASIEEIRPGVFGVEEYQSSGSTPADSPGGWTTKGLPALVLIFHPYYSGTFAMKCEGLATLNGKRAWQIYFRQRKDKPNKIRSYRIGSNAQYYPVALKGRAWIVADSYQILGLQTDLIDAIPDIRLAAEHTAIGYGPVHFSSRGLDMWLPQTAEVYSELRGKRIHRRLSFSNYLLFAVDDKQQIAAPKASP
ncbi:MAG TPA: tetratricopeptide repeat protein [Candidatus Angelobacter sp.]|nr:tetratricopeptide repeat protein [Candidatus Angelobacter sp.]